jgi:hypothetical protein
MFMVVILSTLFHIAIMMESGLLIKEKDCNNELEAQATLEHYKQKDGTQGYYKENNGKWLVYRKEDDKVLKSVNYSPADLKTIINE